MTRVSRYRTESLITKVARWIRATFCYPRHRHEPHRTAPLRRRGAKPLVPSSPNPPHLPAQRIDMRERPLEKQPQSCFFTRLPPELRQCIYDLALGGRVISLWLGVLFPNTHFTVRSACYEPVDAEADCPPALGVPADSIPTGFLFSCRQVYLEALPILHQRNTFHFRVHELVAVVLSGLGRYCLPDIRSIHLLHSYRGFRAPVWATAFALSRRWALKPSWLSSRYSGSSGRTSSST
ncbi:hypothetical protein DFH09DRAFT_1119232 [Mycena vulgaris]|nr:hypothetical protein DFH09DRAFT_1119232 [Mycena vulgaris]